MCCCRQSKHDTITARAVAGRANMIRLLLQDNNIPYHETNTMDEDVFMKEMKPKAVRFLAPVDQTNEIFSLVKARKLLRFGGIFITKCMLSTEIWTTAFAARWRCTNSPKRCNHATSGAKTRSLRCHYRWEYALWRNLRHQSWHNQQNNLDSTNQRRLCKSKSFSTSSHLK